MPRPRILQRLKRLKRSKKEQFEKYLVSASAIPIDLASIELISNVESSFQFQFDPFTISS